MEPIHVAFVFMAGLGVGILIGMALAAWQFEQGWRAAEAAHDPTASTPRASARRSTSASVIPIQRRTGT